MNSLLHPKTPVLTSADGRGALLRTVAYHRAQASEAPSTRVTRQRYDALGHQTEQWDPRLHDLAATDTRVKANQQTRFSLSGQELRSDSVDGGWRVSLFNAAAQAVTLWDGRGTRIRFDYDEQSRPVAQFETAAGDTPEKCVERFAYAANTTEDAQRNRCGRVLRHDDPAGSVWHEAFAVTGQPAIETRRFCISLATPNWPNTPLDPHSYSTRWRYDALGAVMTHTDAAGHVRTFAVDIAGRPCASQLDGLDLLKRCEYNAFDQVEVEQAGNDVLTIASYSPANGLLHRLKANTLAAHLLQDLYYQYDPVGNIERIEDLAQPVQWFAQQQIEAVSTYRYDTLYQLIEATGRENASQRIGPELPGLEIFGARDDSHWRNYTQTYTYDSGANLTSLRHDAGAGNSYLQQMVVAEHSNRSLLKGEVPVDFASGFDANGNLLALIPGQFLQWNARNQVHQVTQVVRAQLDGQDNDLETYLYDGEGQRVRKVRRAKTGGGEQISQTLYLPGLEVRESTRGERLHVMTTQAGRNNVRVLHWEAGRPDEIDQDQWRYSLVDHLGSSTLELDQTGNLISQESYYPYGGTSWWAARNAVQARYKTVRYSGKERDATGLYHYGFRYYAPWLQRWISTDPSGYVDGLNLFAMLRNNPMRYKDKTGLDSTEATAAKTFKAAKKLAIARLGQAQQFLKTLKNKDNALQIGRVFFGSTFDASHLDKWSTQLSHVKSALEKLKTSKNIEYKQAKTGHDQTVAELNTSHYSSENKHNLKYITAYSEKINEINNSAFLGLEHIAHIAIHEISHGALNTEDFKYIGVMGTPGFHDLTQLANLPMLENETVGEPLTLAQRQEKSRKIEDARKNADSFTTATRYLAYAQKDPALVEQLTHAHNTWVTTKKVNPLIIKLEHLY